MSLSHRWRLSPKSMRPSLIAAGGYCCGVLAAGDAQLGRAGQVRTGRLEPLRRLRRRDRFARRGVRRDNRGLAHAAGHQFLQFVEVLVVHAAGHGSRAACRARRPCPRSRPCMPPVRITRTAPRASCVTLMSRPAMNRLGTLRRVEAAVGNPVRLLVRACSAALEMKASPSKPFSYRGSGRCRSIVQPVGTQPSSILLARRPGPPCVRITSPSSRRDSRLPGHVGRPVQLVVGQHSGRRSSARPTRRTWRGSSSRGCTRASSIGS